MSNNKILDEGLSFLADGIKKSTNIFHLNLSNNGLTYKGCEVLCSALEMNESVISLDISSQEGNNKNIIGPKGALALNKLF